MESPKLLKFPKKDRFKECLKTVIREASEDIRPEEVHDDILTEMQNLYSQYDDFVGDAIIIKLHELRALVEDFWDEDN